MASLTKEPETFQHYQVMRRDDGTLWELGRGAMGVTYKAFDMNLRAPVALKVINALHLDSETSRARFVREARAAAGLRHRNVASVYHLGHDDQSFFYAMEYVDGDTVEGMVKHQGPLPAATALQIALQVSRALGAAAKQQLVHRDIKPANLMVVTEDEEEDQLIVKVIDFGLARPAISGEGSANITMGGFVGTPQYASPEQLEEKELDARSDIYSLGITLWYMLAGKPPFSGALGSVFIQQLTKAPPWDHLVGVPQPIRALLAHLLEKDPDKRPQSPVELRREIESCLKKLPSESGRVSLPESSRGRSAETVTPPTTAGTQTETPLTTASDSNGSAVISSALTAVPATGSILGGHFALDYQAGEGNNGRVFRARDVEHGGATVAVKILHPDVVKEPAQLTRLEGNLEKLRAAPHPNLLGFEGLHQSGEVRFLVGEWANGFNLVELLRARGKLGAREALELLAQAAAVADHAKTAQLGRLELGLHQILAHFPDAPLDAKSGTEGARTALGSTIDRWPRFALKFDALGIFREAGDSVTWMGDQTMLPARAGLDRDTQTSIRGLVEDSHIFSLGALVYELLNGSPPAQNRRDEGRDTKYVALPALTEGGNTVLRKALSPNPGFATSAEFFRELRAASGFAEDGFELPNAVTPALIADPADSGADSEAAETLIFDARAHQPAAEPAVEDSAAATLVLHDDEHPVLSPRDAAQEIIARTGQDAPDDAAATVATARSAETGPSHPAIESDRAAAQPDPTAGSPDEVEAPTLQGYSFVSRGEGAAGSPLVIEKDDYGADDVEAPTLQGYSFKTPPAEAADVVIPAHPAEEVAHDDYGSDDVEAPTLQGYSFKAAPADAPVIAPHPEAPAAPDTDGSEENEAPTLQGYSFKTPPTVDPLVARHPETPVVPDTYGSEDVEAQTLQGYSFKTPAADAPEIVVGPGADASHSGITSPGPAEVEDFDAPTLQGYSFKAQPQDAPEIVVPSSDRADTAGPGKPDAAEPAEDFDAPTLLGYSFKAREADVVVPPVEHGSAPQASTTPDESSAADTPTLEGYSFHARSADVVLPAHDDEVASREAKPADEASLKTPEPPPLTSPFLVVPDAPLAEVPPPIAPESHEEALPPLIERPAPLHTDQADVSLDHLETAAPAAKAAAEPPPVSRPPVVPAAKVPPAPAVAVTPFVDKPIFDQQPSEPVKKTNFALIGGAAAVVVVIVAVAGFAMRGGHSSNQTQTPATAQTQPQPTPAVARLTTPAPVKNPVAANPRPTPPPAAAQPTPGPTPVLAVQTTSPAEASPASQGGWANAQSSSAENPAAASVGASVATPDAPAKFTDAAAAGVNEAAATPVAASQAVSRQGEKAEEDRPARTSEKSDEEKPSAESARRTAAAEARRHEQPAPTPRPASREHEREHESKPPAAPVERVVKREAAKPEPPKPVKKEAPKPAADPDVRRGPAVPFMR